MCALEVADNWNHFKPTVYTFTTKPVEIGITGFQISTCPIGLASGFACRMSEKWQFHVLNGDEDNNHFKLTFTTQPVGRCFICAQLDVLATACPPGPPPFINFSSRSASSNTGHG